MRQRPLRPRTPTGVPLLTSTAKMLRSPAGNGVLLVLLSYVSQVLRCPADTEWTYWRVWTPARRLSDGYRSLIRLSVRNHDMLEIVGDDEGLLYVQLLHGSSGIEPVYEAQTGLLEKPRLAVQFTVLEHESFCRALFEAPNYLAAARTFAHEMMVNGPCTIKEISHDGALADFIFSVLPIASRDTS